MLRWDGQRVRDIFWRLDCGGVVTHWPEWHPSSEIGLLGRTHWRNGRRKSSAEKQGRKNAGWKEMTTNVDKVRENKIARSSTWATKNLILKIPKTQTVTWMTPKRHWQDTRTRETTLLSPQLDSTIGEIDPRRNLWKRHYRSRTRLNSIEANRGFSPLSTVALPLPGVLELWNLLRLCIIVLKLMSQKEQICRCLGIWIFCSPWIHAFCDVSVFGALDLGSQVCWSSEIWYICVLLY